MFGYIYKTTNLLNGKIYIGKRKSNIFLKNYFGSGSYIKRSIKKNGIDNFKVKLIFACDSKRQLNSKEIYFIKLYNARDINIGYNIHVGGGDGDTLSKHPNKINIIKKRSKTYKANYKKGKHSVWNKGKKKCFSKQSIQKRLNTIKQRYGKITAWNKGTKGKKSRRGICEWCKKSYALNILKNCHNDHCYDKPGIDKEKEKQRRQSNKKKKVYIFDINKKLLFIFINANVCKQKLKVNNVIYLCKHNKFAYKNYYFSYNRNFK